MLTRSPPLQSTTPGLNRASTDGASRVRHPITAYYSVYRPQKDERLSWLTCMDGLPILNGHPSTAGQGTFADHRQTSTTVPRNQLSKECEPITGVCVSRCNAESITVCW